MSINYTFDEFAKAVKDNNLYMSDADMKLARKDPNIGMGIVNSKLGFLSAKTDEERRKFNEQAESLRKSAGGYIGGSDGSKYLPFLQTPDSFSYEDAPSYVDKYGDTNKETYEAIRDYAPFEYDVEKPVYTDSYSDTANELLNAIVNHGDFSYDHKTDPNYQAYAKQYRREGERAMANTLAQAAANTGGVASTAAVTAAQQANNYYGAQLADKLPQLYDAAYNRWLDEFTLNQNKLAAVQGERANERDKYLSDVAQWESDRNFAREQYNDEYEKLVNTLNYGMAMEESDYDRYRDTVEDHNAKQQFTYNQLLDTIGYRQQEDATRLNNAINAFNTVGDTSLLEAEGIDTTQYQEQLKDAQLLAEYEAQTERLKALADDEGDDKEALRSRAQYIKAMLTTSGTKNYKDLSVDEIVAMLERGYTGFDNLLPYYDGSHYVSPDKITEDDALDWYRNNEGEDFDEYMKSQAIITYYDTYNGIIPEEEWKSAKANGVKASAFTDYSGYEEYVADWMKYLEEEGLYSKQASPK